MTISELLEVLDSPKHQRQAMQYFGTEMAKAYFCYHVTEANKVDGIISTGLVAGECQQGRVTRQAANYLFISKNDANNKEVHGILGISNPAVVKVRLTGEELLEKACADNMWNASFEDFGTAIMYLDNISPEAIK
jgi:hypothetical protein